MLTAESKTYGLFFMTLVPLWCYSAQAIKERTIYELKFADCPYVLTNFCKLLSLTFYSSNFYRKVNLFDNEIECFDH